MRPAVAALLLASPAVAQAPAGLVIEHVTVIDVETGARRPGQTVVVTGNRITGLGDAAPPTVRAAMRIDGTGKFLIPGLWDGHSHALNRPAWGFALDVSHGVTAIRDMAASQPLARVRALQQDVAEGRVIGPRSVASGPLVDGEPEIFPEYLSVTTADAARAVVDSLAREGAAFIKVYTNLGREPFLAILDQARQRGLAVAGHVPLAVTTAEASDAGMRAVEHAYRHRLACATAEETLRRILREQVAAGTRRDWRRVYEIDQENHQLGLDTYSGEKCADLGRRLARNGTWFVPTLVETYARFRPDGPFDPGFDSLFLATHLRAVPAAVVRRWRDQIVYDNGLREAALFSRAEADSAALLRSREIETRLRMVGELHRAGVGIVAGTDASENHPLVVIGHSLHEELGWLVRAGLTPLEALRAATLNPARLLGMTDSLGSVAAGKLADLVLLDADPLLDIGNARRIAGVVLNGRYLDRAALDALVEEATRRVNP